MIKKVYSKKKEERTIIKLDSKIATFVLLPIKRREEKRERKNFFSRSSGSIWEVEAKVANASRKLDRGVSVSPESVAVQSSKCRGGYNRYIRLYTPPPLAFYTLHAAKFPCWLVALSRRSSERPWLWLDAWLCVAAQVPSSTRSLARVLLDPAGPPASNRQRVFAPLSLSFSPSRNWLPPSSAPLPPTHPPPPPSPLSLSSPFASLPIRAVALANRGKLKRASEHCFLRPSLSIPLSFVCGGGRRSRRTTSWDRVPSCWLAEPRVMLFFAVFGGFFIHAPALHTCFSTLAFKFDQIVLLLLLFFCSRFHAIDFRNLRIDNREITRLTF